MVDFPTATAPATVSTRAPLAATASRAAIGVSAEAAGTAGTLARALSTVGW